jgi:hypothetical protein
VETEYQNPVVSLYLQLSPAKVASKQAGLVRFFHSLKTRELEQRKDLDQCTFLRRSRRCSLTT